MEHIRDVDLFNARRGRRLGRFLHCILQTLSSASGLNKHNTNIRYDEVFSNWLTRFTRGIDHHWVSTVRGLGKWSNYTTAPAVGTWNGLACDGMVGPGRISLVFM